MCDPPCQNGGLCVKTAKLHTCACPAGWSGDACSTPGSSNTLSGSSCTDWTTADCLPVWAQASTTGPVDCVLSPETNTSKCAAWSACGNEPTKYSQFQTRVIETPAQNGGQSCAAVAGSTPFCTTVPCNSCPVAPTAQTGVPRLPRLPAMCYATDSGHSKNQMCCAWTGGSNLNNPLGFPYYYMGQFLKSMQQADDLAYNISGPVAGGENGLYFKTTPPDLPAAMQDLADRAFSKAHQFCQSGPFKWEGCNVPAVGAIRKSDATCKTTEPCKIGNFCTTAAPYTTGGDTVTWESMAEAWRDAGMNMDYCPAALIIAGGECAAAPDGTGCSVSRSRNGIWTVDSAASLGQGVLKNPCHAADAVYNQIVRPEGSENLGCYTGPGGSVQTDMYITQETADTIKGVGGADHLYWDTGRKGSPNCNWLGPFCHWQAKPTQPTTDGDGNTSDSTSLTFEPCYFVSGGVGNKMYTSADIGDSTIGAGNIQLNGADPSCGTQDAQTWYNCGFYTTGSALTYNEAFQTLKEKYPGVGIQGQSEGLCRNCSGASGADCNGHVQLVNPDGGGKVACVIHGPHQDYTTVPACTGGHYKNLNADVFQHRANIFHVITTNCRAKSATEDAYFHYSAETDSCQLTAKAFEEAGIPYPTGAPMVLSVGHGVGAGACGSMAFIQQGGTGPHKDNTLVNFQAGMRAWSGEFTDSYGGQAFISQGFSAGNTTNAGDKPPAYCHQPQISELDDAINGPVDALFAALCKDPAIADTTACTAPRPQSQQSRQSDTVTDTTSRQTSACIPKAVSVMSAVWCATAGSQLRCMNSGYSPYCTWSSS